MASDTLPVEAALVREADLLKLRRVEVGAMKVRVTPREEDRRRGRMDCMLSIEKGLRMVRDQRFLMCEQYLKLFSKTNRDIKLFRVKMLYCSEVPIPNTVAMIGWNVPPLDRCEDGFTWCFFIIITS